MSRRRILHYGGTDGLPVKILLPPGFDDRDEETIGISGLFAPYVGLPSGERYHVTFVDTSVWKRLRVERERPFLVSSGLVVLDDITPESVTLAANRLADCGYFASLRAYLGGRNPWRRVGLYGAHCRQESSDAAIHFDMRRTEIEPAATIPDGLRLYLRGGIDLNRLQGIGSIDAWVERPNLQVHDVCFMTPQNAAAALYDNTDNGSPFFAVPGLILVVDTSVATLMMAVSVAEEDQWFGGLQLSNTAPRLNTSV